MRNSCKFACDWHAKLPAFAGKNTRNLQAKAPTVAGKKCPQAQAKKPQLQAKILAIAHKNTHNCRQKHTKNIAIVVLIVFGMTRFSEQYPLLAQNYFLSLLIYLKFNSVEFLLCSRLQNF